MILRKMRKLLPAEGIIAAGKRVLCRVRQHRLAGGPAALDRLSQTPCSLGEISSDQRERVTSRVRQHRLAGGPAAFVCRPPCIAVANDVIFFGLAKLPWATLLPLAPFFLPPETEVSVIDCGVERGNEKDR